MIKYLLKGYTIFYIEIGSQVSFIVLNITLIFYDTLPWYYIELNCKKNIITEAFEFSISFN